MELFLDTANINEIRTLNEILNIDGVTTNPAILAKNGSDPLTTIKEISEVLNNQQKLFVEVMANDCQHMVLEAQFINEIRTNCYAKIPVSSEGLKAIKICKEKGFKTLATAIFTSMQGYLASKNGADYLAPYVNRMDNYLDGVEETIKLQQIINDNGFASKVVAASFKNLNQIKQLMASGIDAITISDELCHKMINHSGTDDAIKQFEQQWQQQFHRCTLK